MSVNKVLEAVFPRLIVLLSVSVGLASADETSDRVPFMSGTEEAFRHVGILGVDAVETGPFRDFVVQRNALSTVAGEEDVYTTFGDLFLSSPSWIVESNQVGAQMGWRVASAGDVNGDGYSDVVVGAPLYQSGEESEGRAFVYHGSASGLSFAAAWTAESNQAHAQFGYSVASAGDVNKDGYSDVIVGANLYDNGQDDEGRVYVYHGGPSGLSSTADWTAESDSTGARLGISVASAGDVNGDGYSDVVVGAIGTAWACVYVYHGSASGLSSAPACTLGNDGLEMQGYEVASAGDVNGDGYSDVIVGSPLWGLAPESEGIAFVHHGSPTGLVSTPAWIAHGEDDFAHFGMSVASAGDVNSDGYSDVIVGAPYYLGFFVRRQNGGWARVYAGSDTGLAADPVWTADCGQDYAIFGMSVASPGDVDGDGYSEVVVGVPGWSTPQTDAGCVFAYAGSATGPSADPVWITEGDQVSGILGYSVAGGGNVNEDSSPDIVIGAHGYDNGEENEGRAYAYHGAPQPKVMPVRGFVVTLIGVALGAFAVLALAKRRVVPEGLR